MFAILREQFYNICSYNTQSSVIWLPYANTINIWYATFCSGTKYVHVKILILRPGDIKSFCEQETQDIPFKSLT